jgi:cytochrome P450
MTLDSEKHTNRLDALALRFDAKSQQVIMASSLRESTEMVIFQAIAVELPGADHRETGRKLKRKFKRRNLGSYDQDQVDMVRALHDELQAEMTKSHLSVYYRGVPGTVASFDNFDTDRIVRDYGDRYRMITFDALYQLVNFAIYLYYLR